MIAELVPVWPLFACMTGGVAIIILADFLVHPLRREMMALGEDILSHPGLTKMERDGIDMMLSTATSFFTGFIFLLAPFVAVFDLLRGKETPPLRMSGVPFEKIGELSRMALVSAFAANPFVGIIWLPFYATLFATLRALHRPAASPLVRAFSQGAQFKRAAHL